MTGGGAPRTGKALEYLVAASCILMSGGKLDVSTPLVDDEGVDLVFNRHDRPVTLAVQIKGRSRSAQVALKGRFLADVAERTFVPRAGLYMLYVVYDEVAADYGPVWLVPSRGVSPSAEPTPEKGRPSVSRPRYEVWRASGPSTESARKACPRRFLLSSTRYRRFA